MGFFIGKSMKLKQQLETTTYISVGGYYCIRQEDQYGDEIVVKLSPSQMDLICVEMKQHIDEQDWWLSEESESNDD